MTFLEKEQYKLLIDELFDKYYIESFEVRNIINIALSKTYNCQTVSLSDEGYIIGLFLMDMSKKYQLKYFNISQQKYQKFLKILNEELMNCSLKKVQKIFRSIVSGNNGFIYAQPCKVKNNQVEFRFYNKNKKEIKNFYTELQVSERNFFKQEFLEKRYLYENEGFLFYVPKREKIKEYNGRFKVKVIRVHEQVVRHKLNTIFKKIKHNLGKSYGYEKCYIDLKNKKITLFINTLISNEIKQFITSELLELDSFELILIAKFKKKDKMHDKKKF